MLNSENNVSLAPFGPFSSVSISKILRRKLKEEGAAA